MQLERMTELGADAIVRCEEIRAEQNNEDL
jgi:hypothetical protein